VNFELYLNYDVVARRMGTTIVVESSKVLGLPSVFVNEKELMDSLLQKNPMATYIILERVNG
jgi:hypothetical protein